MHLEETYTGFMRVASNRAGKPYKDWREHYIDQAGLILIFQSDSRPGKYAVYFFLPRGIYEFDIDLTCVSKEVLPTLIANAQIYFDSKIEVNVAGQ